MRRYILMYQGLGPNVGDVAEEIAASPALHIVERFNDNLVVEGEDRDLKRFIRSLKGWVASPERRVRPPDIHEHIKRRE